MSQEEVRSSSVTGVVVPTEGPKTAVPSDNPSLLISPVKLDGSNCLAWSWSCKLFIKARGLEDYITSMKSQKPNAGDVQA